MLTAQKSAWFERIFALYNRNLFRRRFHSFNVSGLGALGGRDLRTPLIIYANHSSWWDGLVAFEISRRAGLESFVMMEEKHLKKLFLFRRLGAFSVVRESPRQAVQSVNYAVDLLREKKDRTLWIFPQGEILPQEARPLKFYRGTARIVGKLENCQTAPLAMRYEFRGEFKPEIFVRIGAPEFNENDEKSSPQTLTKNLEMRLTALLDDLKNDVVANNLDDYSKII